MPKLTYSNAVYLCALLICAMDQFLVVIILTGVSVYYDLTPLWGVWFISTFTLFYALIQPIAGKFINQYGYKKMLIIGLSCTTFGALSSIFAPYFWMLLLFRSVSAVGAGVIYPTVVSFLNYNVSENQKGAIFGFVGFMFSFSAIIPPIISGIVLDIFSWQMSMLIIMIPSIICLLFVSRLPKIKSYGKQTIDILGVTTLVIIGLLFMLALTLLDVDFSLYTLGLSMSLILLAVFLIFVFVKISIKAKDPVLDIKYFQNRNMLITFAVCFSVFYLVQVS